jgi:hypothetical protein
MLRSILCLSILAFLSNTSTAQTYIMPHAGGASIYDSANGVMHSWSPEMWNLHQGTIDPYGGGSYWRYTMPPPGVYGYSGGYGYGRIFDPPVQRYRKDWGAEAARRMAIHDAMKAEILRKQMKQ